MKLQKIQDQDGFGLIGSMIMMVALLALATSIMTVSVATTRYAQRSYLDSDAMQLADAGAEKGVWAFNKNTSYTGETTSYGDGSFTTSVVPIDSNNKYVTSVATINRGGKTYTKRVKIKINTLPNSNNVAFNYAIQTGNGGLQMDNNSGITGTVYSSGAINGSNGSKITGDAFVSGAANKILIPNVTHDAHAHTIQSTTVGHDAYYTTLTSSTVVGTKHPGSADPAAIAFPITAQNVTDWETAAAAGGSQGATNISGTVNLGPKKIAGDLTFTNNCTLNVTGTIWITGNMNLANNCTVKLDPSFGANSGVIIVDDPSNQAAHGKITISNNAIINGSGNSKSFINFVSTNTGQSDVGAAISVQNNANSAVLYSTQGEINISNNVAVKAATGYKLHLNNGASVTYDAGLANENIQFGPGGSWTVISWQEY